MSKKKNRMTKNRMVDLSSLPRYYKGIDWKNTIGYKIPFKYDNQAGFFKIVKYIDSHNMGVEYKNKIKIIQKDSIINARLATMLDIRKVDFVYKIGDIVDVFSGKIQVLDTRKDGRKIYDCKCLVCNSEFSKLEHLLLGHSGCPVCANKKVAIGINDMWTTAPELAELLFDKTDGYRYVKNSNNKVDWVCPTCGEIIYNKTISNIYKQGLTCPVCGKSKSYPNRFMYSLLKHLNVEFKDEKSFKWSNNKKYDFYLKDYNIIIEMHGKQHYDEDMFETCKSIQQNDKYKKDLALSNGISKENYIVIDARYSTMEWIKKSVVDSKLSMIFDLSNIAWLEVERFSQLNLLKEACRLWDEGENDIKKIAKQIGCHFSTTSRFLRKGEQLGITTYTVEESNRLGAIRQSEACYQNSGTPFICIETCQVFGSILSCCNNSQEVFGVKLDRHCVKFVLDGKQSKTRNYTFQYITREEFNKVKQESPELAFGDFFIS